MARKPRPDPITQGSLANIYKWFIGPLVLNQKPERQDMREFMEMIFDFKNREIVRYVAKRDFVCPGLLYLAPAMKVQGIGYRDVKAGTELWVRKDARNPDSIDVEFMGGQGGKDLVYQLTLSEWRWVSLNLDEAEREKKV